MSFTASTPIEYRLYDNGGAATGEPSSHQVLEVRLSYFRRLVSGSPSVGVPPRILHETAPIPMNNGLFHLSLRQLQDPLFYVTQFLSSLNIRAAACEVIATQIASYIVQRSAGNGETNFHIIAEVDYIRLITWMRPIPILNHRRRSNDGAALMEEETVILEEAPPARRGVAEWAMERVRKLKVEENGEQLGDCSICLDEMNGKSKEVIKIPCGHFYHGSCIFNWLHNHNSCPLCRKPLPLEG